MRYHRVLFIAIAASATLALAAGTARAQDLPLDPLTSLPSFDPMEDVVDIEPERPREFSSFGFEREGNRRLFTAGDVGFEHRRERDDSDDGRRTRFEQFYFPNDDGTSVRWTLWRSKDRQDFHGGTKHRAAGVALTIAF